MTERKTIFIYPITKKLMEPGSNSYIRNLVSHLGKEFEIANGVTSIGLFDAFLNFRKSDVFYFNWAEDISTKRFGILQTIALPFLLLLSKVSGKKIVWFVHNNVSHYKRLFLLKKVIIRLMSIFADVILSHSAEITIKVPKERLHVFHHPIEEYRPFFRLDGIKFDLLIWGSVSSYKGVCEFVRYASKSNSLAKYKIMIAGRFDSNEYYETVTREKSDNIEVVNKMLSDDELDDLFSISKYILFTYTSKSILSSASLCKSLSYGKEVIAPRIGAFKELADKGLVYTYDSFQDLEVLLKEIGENKRAKVDQRLLSNYIKETSWPTFTTFLSQHINQLFAEKSYRFVSNG